MKEKHSKYCSQITKLNQEGQSTAQKPGTVARPKVLLETIYASLV